MRKIVKRAGMTILIIKNIISRGSSFTILLLNTTSGNTMVRVLPCRFIEQRSST